jgi:hypothetical protein
MENLFWSLGWVTIPLISDVLGLVGSSFLCSIFLRCGAMRRVKSHPFSVAASLRSEFHCYYLVVAAGS